MTVPAAYSVTGLVAGLLGCLLMIMVDLSLPDGLPYRWQIYVFSAVNSAVLLMFAYGAHALISAAR